METGFMNANKTTVLFLTLFLFNSCAMELYNPFVTDSYTPEPTPISLSRVVSPVMSPGGGTYDSDQDVALTCETSGATIRYTTDGSDPTESSTVYSTPISVAGIGTSMTIKAYATKAGMLDSTISTGTYSIQSVAIAGITSSTSNGTYGIDSVINVTVTFSEPVILAGGTLSIQLDTGAVVEITPFGPSVSASCTYTIGSGESSGGLDSTGITLDGGTIENISGYPVVVELPSTTINDGSTITVDGIRPVISSFTLTSGSPTTSHFLAFSLEGSDNESGITHWFVNESGTPPAANDPGWISTKPDAFRTTPGYMTKTIYAWAKDGAANVSDAAVGSNFDVIIEYIGASSWAFEKNAVSEDLPTGAAIDYDDNIYIAGLKENTTSDWQIIKLRPDGTEDTVNWNKQIDWYGSSDCAQAVVTDSADNVYVCGYFRNGSDDIWGIMKFNANGTELWRREWNRNTGSDIAQGITVDSQDNIYVVGYITNASSNLDWWMKKYYPDGSEDTANWNFGYDNGYGNDTAISISMDSSDNVYVAGTATSSNGDVDWMVRKYSNNGAFAWSMQYNRAANNKPDRAYTIVVDSSDDVYAAGYSTNTSDNIDWAIKKFDSSGNEDTANWDKTVDQGTSDVVWGIGTDANNNVYVGGRLLYTDDEWTVIKYNSSGTELWRDVISNTGPDWCRAIVVDSMNYAYGFGAMYRPGNGSDWYIKKYAP